MPAYGTERLYTGGPAKVRQKRISPTANAPVRADMPSRLLFVPKFPIFCVRTHVARV